MLKILVAESLGLQTMHEVTVLGKEYVPEQIHMLKYRINEQPGAKWN